MLLQGLIVALMNKAALTFFDCFESFKFSLSQKKFNLCLFDLDNV